MPQLAAGTAGSVYVLGNLTVQVAASLACPAAWVTVSTSPPSRRRALQATSSVTWYALVVSPAGASASTVAAVNANLNAVSTTLTTAALQTTFTAMAAAANIPATGFAVAGVSSAPTGAAGSAATGLSTGAIVGIAIGTAVAAALIVAGIVVACTMRARQVAAAPALDKDGEVAAPPGVAGAAVLT